jgi:septal ring factor EnvC (AmiA/AmiB activator)
LGRSLANFGTAFTLPLDYLLAVRAHKRIGGLTRAAELYLQHRLAILLMRMAQDDYSWPSEDDLTHKVAGLIGQIAQAKDELSKTKSDTEELEQRIKELEAEHAQASSRLAAADDLEEASQVEPAT